MLLLLKPKHPFVYCTLELVAAFFIGGDSINKIFASNDDPSTGWLGVAGAIYFSRDAIETFHAVRQKKPEQSTEGQ